MRVTRHDLDRVAAKLAALCEARFWSCRMERGPQPGEWFIEEHTPGDGVRRVYLMRAMDNGGCDYVFGQHGWLGRPAAHAGMYFAIEVLEHVLGWPEAERRYQVYLNRETTTGARK